MDISPSGDIRNDKLRGKLVNVGERFLGFDSIVRDDAVKRKAIEERKYQELTDTLSRLEKSLNAEIKRRLDANKTLQLMIEQMASEMYENIQKGVQRRIDKLAIRLDELNNRGQELMTGIRQMKGEIPSKLAHDARVLNEELNRLKQQFEVESSGAIEKDTLFSRRAAEMEYSLDKRMDTETSISNEQFDMIRKGIDELSRADTAVEDQFRGFTLEELSSMKNGLVLCAQARESSDDEIINAINSYTNSLQKILRASAI